MPILGDKKMSHLRFLFLPSFVCAFRGDDCMEGEVKDQRKEMSFPINFFENLECLKKYFKMKYLRRTRGVDIGL